MIVTGGIMKRFLEALRAHHALFCVHRLRCDAQTSARTLGLL
jgi:hypothetical protein